jgi:hypothetical protein
MQSNKKTQENFYANSVPAVAEAHAISHKAILLNKLGVLKSGNNLIAQGDCLKVRL